MLFYTFEFQVLFVLTLVLYYKFPQRRVAVIGLANAIFYGVTGMPYLILFLAVAWTTYYAAKKMPSKHGAFFFGLGLGVNLLNLLFFKYSVFIAEAVLGILRVQIDLSTTFLSTIVLPIGISFYTFQLIAYLVDVKRGEVIPEKSFLVFWVFISFFGQLIAGPIMRANGFMPQIEKLSTYQIRQENLQKGIFFIMSGLIKKLVIADNLAPMVIPYFNGTMPLTTISAWIGAYLFGFQIYFDFSAYSEIAVGIGAFFGLDLEINFKTPYLSGNPPEFWNRWHITLSRWIRDYIYIPLGGNRRGFWKGCLFVLIAMSISGLWHGAAWTFLVWGVFHGIVSALNRIYVKYLSGFRERVKQKKWYRNVCVFGFFQLVTIGWVFFRAASFQEAVHFIQLMLVPTNLFYHVSYVKSFLLIAVLYLSHVVEFLIHKNQVNLSGTWNRTPEFIRAAVIVLVMITVIWSSPTEQSAFIYFQF